MPGDVTQVGRNRWRLRVPLGRDPATGRYRRASKVIDATSKRGATLELARFAEELAAKPRADLTDATMGTLLDRWLANIEHTRSPTTIRVYRSYIKGHIRPALGDIPLRDLTSEPIDRLYSEMRAKGRSERTIRQTHAIIHNALRQGIRWDWLIANPAERAEAPKLSRPDIHPPSPAEIRRLVEGARNDNPSLATFILIAAMTGARRGELCALRWTDVDLDRGSMTIGRSLIDVAGRIVEKDTKTHQARVIALPPEAVTVLSAHRRILEARAVEKDAELEPAAFVWPAPYSLNGRQAWRPDQVTGAFRALCGKAGVKVRLHDLRHAQASQLLAAGVDVRTVAGRLGHANPSTTLSIYAHWLPAADRQAAALAGSIFALPPGED